MTIPKIKKSRMTGFRFNIAISQNKLLLNANKTYRLLWWKGKPGETPISPLSFTVCIFSSINNEMVYLYLPLTYVMPILSIY